MDELQEMKNDFTAALMAMEDQQLVDLETALTAAIQALLTIPRLRVGSPAALHMERLQHNLDGLRAIIEQIDKSGRI